MVIFTAPRRTFLNFTTAAVPHMARNDQARDRLVSNLPGGRRRRKVVSFLHAQLPPAAPLHAIHGGRRAFLIRGVIKKKVAAGYATRSWTRSDIWLPPVVINPSKGQRKNQGRAASQRLEAPIPNGERAEPIKSAARAVLVARDHLQWEFSYNRQRLHSGPISL